MDGDPLRDPRFPERPQHRDFWRLSEIVLRLDGRATEDGIGPAELSVEAGVDIDSLTYLMIGRASNVLDSMGYPDALVPLLAAAMTDAFMVGLLFEREREAPPDGAEQPESKQ